MDTILSLFQGFVNLGAAVMLPVVIAILGIFFKMKPGKAVKSGLLVGIGFQGLCLVVNLLTTTVQPVMDYYEEMGSGYDVLEIGFAALGGASWTVPFAVLVIPALVILNLIMIRFKITKVLNVDIWNFMHFLVPGALAYALFGSAEIYIGMDIALGLGDPGCITCTGIMIPITIALAFLVPDMRFFPLGILAEVCYLAPMCVLTSRGNVFRTLICMIIMMYATANMFAPEATQMMSVTDVK